MHAFLGTRGQAKARRLAPLDGGSLEPLHRRTGAADGPPRPLPKVLPKDGLVRTFLSLPVPNHRLSPPVPTEVGARSGLTALSHTYQTASTGYSRARPLATAPATLRGLRASVRRAYCAAL